MSDARPQASDADQQLRDFGYEQELTRALGRFSSFAVSFGAVGISAGVFITIPVIWASSGTIGIWSWIPSSVGALLIALVFADLVGRIPLAGYAYQWSARLANRPIGFMTGVAGLMGFGIGTAGTIYGVTPYFLAQLGIETTRGTTIVGGIVLTAVVCTVLIIGTRLAAIVNNVAVIVEIVCGIGVALVLLVVAILNRPRDVSVLFEPAPGSTGHSGYAFLLAFLLGAFLYAGWELPADMAEETKEAPDTAARTMLWSIGAVAVSGLVMVIAFSYATPDLAITLQSATPVLSVVEFHFGSTAAAIYNALCLVAFFGVSLLIAAGATRLLFSMARDGLVPGSALLRRITPRSRTPAGATVGVGLFSIAMFTVPQLYSSDVQSTIFGTAAVGYNLVYAVMAGTYLVTAQSRGLPLSYGRFTLGRWGAPVAAIALGWQLFVVATLTLPAQNHHTGWTALILLGMGGLWYIGWRRTR